MLLLPEPHIYADMPPTRLIPQADGAPLPPRDPHIADSWPPNLKGLVNNLLSLFENREFAPTVDEIEHRLQIKLEERPLTQYESRTAKRYAVTEARFLRRGGLGTGDIYQSYRISKGQPGDSKVLHTLSLPVQDETACLNPYELAVYTGSSFANGQVPPPEGPAPRNWGSAYVWGMFRWSESGDYFAKGYSILVGGTVDARTGERNSVGCVLAISVAKGFPRD